MWKYKAIDQVAAPEIKKEGAKEVGNLSDSTIENWRSYSLTEGVQENVLYPKDLGRICGDGHPNAHNVIELQYCEDDNYKRIYYHYPSKTLFYAFENEQGNTTVLLANSKERTLKTLLDTAEIDTSFSNLGSPFSKDGKYVVYNLETEDQKTCYKFVQDTESGDLIFDKTYFDCTDLVFWSKDQMGICNNKGEILIANESDKFSQIKRLYTTNGKVVPCNFDEDNNILFSDSIKTKEYIKDKDTDMFAPVWKLDTATEKVEFHSTQYLGDRFLKK